MFSKAFIDKIIKYEKRGYKLSKALISHIVYWTPKDIPKEEQKEKERLVILPSLELVKK